MGTKRKLNLKKGGSPKKIGKVELVSANPIHTQPRQLRSALKSKTPKESPKEAPKEAKKAVAFSPSAKKKARDLTAISNKSKTIKKGKSFTLLLKNKKAVEKPKVLTKKKERKAFYKAGKNNYEIITQAKKVWEKLRDAKNKDKIPENANELYNYIKGNASQLVYAHDTSRVIECLMSLAPLDVKNAVYDELKTEIVKMSESKYAKFFVLSILRHGSPEQKKEVISVLTKDIVRLMKHTEAGSVVEDVYNEFATTSQRKSMLEPFYGNYILYKLAGDQPFSEIMKDQIKRQVILEFMKKALMDMVRKSVICYSLVHKILRDYLDYCNEPDREEMIDAIKENVVQILHTRDGSRIAMKCVWYGSVKIRKTIVKSFKTHVTKICNEKQGRLVLMAIFDCVDDTEIVKKIIIKEIIANLNDIISNDEGKLIIVYLLAHRNSYYMSSEFIDILKEGDSNKISKKDVDLRQKELLVSIAPAVSKYFAENAKDLILNIKLTKVAQAIATCTPDFADSYFEKIASLMTEALEPGEKCEHIIENSIGHMFLKKLLQHDKLLHMKSQNAEKVELFSKKLMSLIDGDEILTWLKCNRGIYTIIHILETGVESVIEKLRNILKPMHEQLQKSSFAGAAILLKKLKEMED